MTKLGSDKNLFGKEIIGYRELRENISHVFESVTNNYKVVFSGNAKKVNNGKTAAIISTNMLNEILTAYKFDTTINFDDKTGQWAVAIDEIGIYNNGFGKEETVNEIVDQVVAATEDYFENADLNARIPEMKKMYPYFLRISQCQGRDELIEVLGLAK